METITEPEYIWQDTSGKIELAFAEASDPDWDALEAQAKAYPSETIRQVLADSLGDYQHESEEEDISLFLGLAAMQASEYADMPSQAIYGFAESLDTSELGGLPECYRGQKVYEISIGTKDAAYGGWYFPVAYYIDYDSSEYTDEECEAFGDWELECLSDNGTQSSHGPIPDDAIELVSHKDVLAWFKDCADASEGSDKPSVRYMVDCDHSDYWGFADSVLLAIESEA